MSNAGKWDRWYGLCFRPEPYGDTVTYQMCADWLAGCDLVEDWGCGKGWFRQFITPPTRYRGIDGSCSPYADIVVDLVAYRSDVAGIMLRHVLEHDYSWAKILDNAASSARERLAVVLFTPLVDETREVDWEDDPGVPDLAFRLDDIIDRLAGWSWTVQTVATDTKYETETVILAERAS